MYGMYCLHRSSSSVHSFGLKIRNYNQLLYATRVKVRRAPVRGRDPNILKWSALEANYQTK